MLGDGDVEQDIPGRFGKDAVARKDRIARPAKVVFFLGKPCPVKLDDDIMAVGVFPVGGFGREPAILPGQQGPDPVSLLAQVRQCGFKVGGGRCARCFDRLFRAFALEILAAVPCLAKKQGTICHHAARTCVTLPSTGYSLGIVP